MRAGQVAVVAGFHGINETGDIVTLGRGGSDTTAVAIAAALGVGSCDIYTDVDGVFTADPRVVPTARLIPVVNSAVMAEMAFAGARVLHSRSAHLADRFGVDIHVRNSAHDDPGTIVRAARNGDEMLETQSPLVGIAHADGMARVVVHGQAPGSDQGIAFLTALAAGAIPVDIVTSVNDARFGLGMDVTVPAGQLAAVRSIAARLGHRCTVTRPVATVSLIGSGLLDRPEYAARVLSALTGAGIPVHSVVLSQLRCAVIIDSHRLIAAVQLLHNEFDLDLGAQDLTAVTAEPALIDAVDRRG
jgi:aspartate kinase